MTNSNPPVYVIWYGDWSGRAGSQQIVRDFITGLSGSAYWAINHTYFVDCSNPLIGCTGSGRVSTGIRLATQVNDLYSQGGTMNGTAATNVIHAKIASGALPADPNALYLIMLTPDVHDTANGGATCGYHGIDDGYANGGAGGLKFEVVRSDMSTATTLNGAGSGCIIQWSNSPNGDTMADALVNVVAHELAETVTDPNPSFKGYAIYTYPSENADQCAWNMGVNTPIVYQAPNGSKANVHLGSRDFFVQQILVNGKDTSYCAIAAPANP